MAKRSIVTATQNAIADVTRIGIDNAATLAGNAAEAVASTATGAMLSAVRAARRFVAVPKPRRKKKTARKTARRKAKAGRKAAAKRGAAKRAVQAKVRAQGQSKTARRAKRRR